MKMNDSCDLFLKFLAGVYIENVNLDISCDTIYDYMINSEFYGDSINKILPKSLSRICNQLYKKYLNDKEIDVYDSNYWFVLINRCNTDLDVYRDIINNSIKLYISLDSKDLLENIQKIITFMKSNNIIAEVKVSKSLRSDLLILRISNIDSVKKFEHFINNDLNVVYRGINPFMYSVNGISITMDGTLSYIYVISEILSSYLYIRKKENLLDNVGYKDFVYFLNNEYRSLLGIDEKHYDEVLEQIKNSREILESHYKIMIFDILLNHLNGDIDSINYFTKYYNKNIVISDRKNLSKYNKLLESMLKVYSVADTYDIFYKYIKEENILYFTKEFGIRNFVYNNYNSVNLEKNINEYVWVSLLNAYKNTKDKYGDFQANIAIEDIINNRNISKFTNDSNVRNILGYTVPINVLIHVVSNKLIEKGLIFNIDNLIKIIKDEIGSNL